MFTRLIASLACAISVAAQEPTRIALAARTGTVPHGFTNVTSVRELADGRVLLIDARERTVFVADFATKSVTAVGRQGQGPLEYSRPLHLVPLPNGRTLVQDPGNARFLEVGSDAAIRGVWSAVGETNASITLPPRSIAMDAWRSDLFGRLYYEPYPRTAGAVTRAAVVRLDVRQRIVDTAATYTLRNRTGAYEVSSPRANELVVQEHVWTPRSQWLVAPDGRIALAEPDPYRVLWLSDAKRVEGAPVQFTPVRVTERDREEYLEARGRPAGGGPAGTARNPVKRAGEPIFPATMPPFVGRESLQLAPDGRLWIARSKNATNPIQAYHVFDAGGRLTGTVELPPDRRIVGFGARAMFVIHRDADDLEYLERYRW